MNYDSVQCGDTTCPFVKNGTCKFGAFDEIPCHELSEKEFDKLKEEVEDGKNTL